MGSVKIIKEWLEPADGHLDARLYHLPKESKYFLDFNMCKDTCEVILNEDSRNLFMRIEYLEGMRVDFIKALSDYLTFSVY